MDFSSPARPPPLRDSATSAATASDQNDGDRRRLRLSVRFASSLRRSIFRGIAPAGAGWAPGVAMAKASIVSAILSSWSRPREIEAVGDRPAHRLPHGGRDERAAGIALGHQARRDIDAVAQQVAVRLHDHVAQMHADAHFRLAGLGEFDGRLHRGEA